MKIKKVLSLILSAVMVTSMVASCGSGGSNAGDSEKGGVTEMKLLTYKAGENVGAKFFLPQVERFNEKYEGEYKITIEEVVQDSYAEKIKQLAQQKKLPALVHAGIDNEWFRKIAVPNGMAYDLSEWLDSKPEVKKVCLEDSIEYCKIDGKLAVMPMYRISPIGLYYNSELYSPDKSIGSMTYDEFVKSLGKNKVALQTGENAWTSMLILSALIANNGGTELLQNSTDTKLYDYTDPSIVKSVEQLKELFDTNAASNSIGAVYADSANAFMSENAAVIANGTWMNAEFAPESKEKWSNNFDGANVKSDIYFGNIALANSRGFGDFWVTTQASDEEREVALAFLEFIYSQDEIEAHILAEGGEAPNIEYSEEFLTELSKDPLLSQITKALSAEGVKYVPSFGDCLPSSIAESEISKLLPQLLDGTLTAKQFCEELTKKAQAIKE